MRRMIALFIISVTLLMAGASWAGTPAAQRRRPPSTPPTGQAEPRRDEPRADQPRGDEGRRDEPRPPDGRRAETRPPVHRGSVVFVGGYFYDPVFGPYPWWPRGAYPYWYYPAFQNRAVVRVMAEPANAAVYVDGFYAGIVDDFDGFFQGLPLPPGGHEITLYLEGYRTVHRRIYVASGTTFKLREEMERLPPGVVSDPPALAPPVPMPPEGSYLPPRTAAPPLPPPAGAPDSSEEACPMGTLTLRVQPSSAEVWVDGERWVSSDAGSFVIEVPAGPHRIQVRGSGYREYSGNIDVRDGETTRLDVTLMRDHS